MTEKEKATVDYSPAPTGQNQSLVTKPTTIIPQTNAKFNENFTQKRLFTELNKGGANI